MVRTHHRARGVVALALLMSVLLTMSAPQLAAAQAQPSTLFMGFAANGMCVLGSCPPTQPKPIGTDLTIPFSSQVLVNGDLYQVVGSSRLRDSLSGTSWSFSYAVPFSVQLIHAAAGTMSGQSDTLTLVASREWTCGSPNATLNVHQSASGTFSSNIAASSTVQISGLLGTFSATFGSFSPPNAFNQTQDSTTQCTSTLSGSTTTTVTFGASSAVGSYVTLGGATAPTSPVVLFSPPQRLIDTRTAGGPISTGQSRCFTMAGAGGIPSNAVGVVLNATAVGYGARGWLTLYPAGQQVPATSTLNFDTTEYAMANGAIIPLGTDGEVCVNVGTIGNAPGSSQVVLDATGYLTSASASAVAMLGSPQRLVDTRTGGGSIATGQSRCFTLAGQGGIPSNAAAVVLNATAVGYPTQGWLTLYPAGQSVPATSTVNFDTTEYAMANGAIIPLGTNGQVCVNVGTIGSAPGSSHVVLDATGYLTQASTAQLPMLTSPLRLVDTRAAGGGPISTGASRCFTLAGVSGIPSNAVAVIVNATAVGYGTQGWLTLYPAGQSVPATSTLNFDTTEYAMANGAIVALGTSGQLCVNVGTLGSAPGSSQAILDVVGFVL